MKKSYGQHFLKDESLIRKIVSAADIGADDFVVEVGPGAGALTDHLPQDRLILIEADKELIPDLYARFPDTRIIGADATSIDYSELVGDHPWVLIGNLPYNAANAIIKQALQTVGTRHATPLRLKRLVVMVQKEVAQRMMATPGKNMSALSVAVGLYGMPTRVMDVQPGSFQPPPKVMSSVIRLDVAPKVDDPEHVMSIATAGFSARRKQLHKNLAAAGIASSDEIKTALAEMGIRPDVRAQDVSIDQWIVLSDFFPKRLMPNA